MYQSLNSFDSVDWGNPVNWSHSLNRGLLAWWLVAPNRQGWKSYRLRDLCRRYHGTLTNMPNGSCWVGNHFGVPSLLYDDTDDYVLCRSGSIAATLTDCTVSSRFYTANADNAGGGGRAIYAERAASGNDIFKLDYSDDTSLGRPFFTWRNDGGTLTQVRPSSGTYNNQWVTFDVVVAGTAVTIYINGVSAGTGTVSTKNFTDAGLDSRIGGDARGTAATWGGNISSVRIHSVALSASEIAAKYQIERRGWGAMLSRVQLSRTGAQATSTFQAAWARNSNVLITPGIV